MRNGSKREQIYLIYATSKVSLTGAGPSGYVEKGPYFAKVSHVTSAERGKNDTTENIGLYSFEFDYGLKIPAGTQIKYNGEVYRMKGPPRQDHERRRKMTVLAENINERGFYA